MTTPVCIICRKILEKDPSILHGGIVQISFFYGSKHDMELGIDDSAKPALGYICDDCFDVVKERTDYQSQVDCGNKPPVTP